ncbi:MAG: ABC transporter ATP-binding protein [Rubrivivax sp.]|jgi:multiple sugar transport system ATP-binding protein|nr:ABC transporter ATP-binding protein [Rubrivivax sp.]
MASVHIDSIDIVLGGVPILKNLSLDIANGEFLVLLGPSGCGKSTLLHTLAGFNDVAEGSIRIGERDVTWADPKDREIGMVFQSYALYPTMNVERNMSFGLRVAGVPREEINRRITRVAQMLHLGELLARRPAQLSGGQRQRVAIGRALVRDAKVYLFDEPLSNLDAKLRAELRRELKQLHQTLGATMVYVTHDQVEAMTLADRIAVMKAGEIQQIGTPQEIYHRPANLFVAGFLGSPTMNLLRGRLAGQGDTWRFEGEALVSGLEAYPFRNAPAAGREVVLGLRPEHLRLAGAPSPSTPHGGRVTVVEPLGAQNIVWFECGGMQLSGMVDDRWDVAPGQRMAFGIDPARASLFDAASDARL